MNVFHHHLESVETSCFGDLDLSHESPGQILEDDAVRGSEECKDILDEMFLVVTELVPIIHVGSKIDFFRGPETSHLFLVHLPDVVVSNWQYNKSVWVLFKKWFVQHDLGLSLVL